MERICLARAELMPLLCIGRAEVRPVKSKRQHHPWGLILAGALGLVIGTVAGAEVGALSRTWLGHPLALTPWTLNLFVVGIRIWIHTNVSGLVLAFIGVLVYSAI